MVIKYPVCTVVLASIIFIGPNSQALLSNTSLDSSNDNMRYHCTSGYQHRKIHITQHLHDLYIKACHVSYQKGNGLEQVLWRNQRNIHNCESKAAALALRLEDRGWKCQAS